MIEKKEIDKEKVDFLLSRFAKKDLSRKLNYNYTYVISVINGIILPSPEFNRRLNLLYESEALND